MRRGYMDAMTIDQLFDALAVRLRAEDVGGVDVRVNLRFTDVDQTWHVILSNRVLHVVPDLLPEADATVELDRSVMIEIGIVELSASEAIDAGRVVVTGDAAAFTVLFDHLDSFASMFPIVEP